MLTSCYSKGNSGLGKETVLQLAKHNPKAIILCCRTMSKGQEALKDVKTVASDANVEILELDLASFKSIEINNAGLVCHQQSSPENTRKMVTELTPFADGRPTDKNSRGI